MSRDSRRNTANVNEAVKEAKENKEERFEIINESLVPFEHLAEEQITTSTTICEMANAIFTKVYADFEGTTFEVSKDGTPYLCLWFNHNVYDESKTKKKMAFSRFEDSENHSTNKTVERVKNYNRRSRMGDRYRITKCGKEGLDKFMCNIVDNLAIRNRRPGSKRNINWELCCIDVAEPQGILNGQQAQKEFSKVSYIDISAIYAFRSGNKIATNIIDRNTGEQLVSKVEYFPTIIGARVNSFGQKEFTLNVKQINSDELHVVLTDFNVKNYSPLGINKSVGR